MPNYKYLIINGHTQSVWNIWCYIYLHFNDQVLILTQQVSHIPPCG